MKPAELPELLAFLRGRLADAQGVSVALSGSLARGDYRTGADGTVVSDLDLIPIVPGPDAVAPVRALLMPLLQETADRFEIEATAAITVLDAYRLARPAGYVTSMGAKPKFLVDGLGVADLPPMELTTAAAVAWMVQPVTYYLAKATHDAPRTNLYKARAAMIRLFDHVGQVDADDLADMAVASQQVADQHGSRLLTSSLTYLTAPTSPAIFTVVRDLVFAENQGVAFGESVMAATPQPS
ncbi:hypothetical protein AB0A05_27500 [Streptomyces sp. NPDC046374]|uniref:hypothetical protein n=1 Tax=Streptomyces sp. NPDC046374 TaxID=3154917 RepID=UPI0033D6A9BB